MIAQDWTEAQKRAYILADNKLTLNAGWDDALLSAELDDLRDLEFDLDLMGFERNELNSLIGTPNSPTGFPAVDENIDIEHHCPRCGFAWSGGTGAKIE